jgi:plastocyanin
MGMTSTQPLRRMTFWVVFVCLVALSTVLSACGGDATSASTSSSGSAPSTTQSNAAKVATTITIREKTGGHDIYSFDPPSVTIKAGQAVLFDNQSDEFHLLMTANASGNPTADATPFTATTIVPTSRWPLRPVHNRYNVRLSKYHVHENQRDQGIREAAMLL